MFDLVKYILYLASILTIYYDISTKKIYMATARAGHICNLISQLQF